MASNSNGSNSKLQTPQKPQFKSGTLVEVSSDDDGFRGSWYTAKVIKRASSKNSDKYLVEYQKLFDDDAGEKPLQEILDWAQLRPVAPREKKRKFRFGEKVDAFHNDGWWEGSITYERENGKFAVFFRGTREQIVFAEQDLRLHREWINGEWKPPLEELQVQKKRKMEDVVTVEDDEEEEVVDEVTPPNKTGVNPNETVAEEFSKGMLVEVISSEEGFEGAWFGATIIEAVGKDKYLIEYTAVRTEDDSGFLREEIETEYIRPSPPETIVVDRFKLLGEVDALYNDGWWVGVISKVLIDCKYIVYFRESKEALMFRHSDLRLHQDWIAGQWTTPSLTHELGCKPTATELYKCMHSSKADKSVMIDKRAQDMSDAIAQRLAEASQTPPSVDGSSTGTVNMDETQLFLDIEGVNKKHCVYGLGSSTSAYVDTAASSRACSSSSQSVQMRDEDFDRRIQVGIQAGMKDCIRQWSADFETQMADFQANNEKRIAELVRAELAKLMPNLPPEFRPSTDQPGDDDDTSAQ